MMKTIKAKLLIPTLLVILVVPLVTLLVFNLAMHLYIQKASRSELKTAMQAVEVIAKGKLSAASLGADRIDLTAQKLTQPLNRYAAMANIQLVLIDEKQRLLYPLEENGLSADLRPRVALKARAAASTGRITEVRLGSESYLISARTVTIQNKKDTVTVVLLSQMGTAGKLLQTVNLILIAVMLMGILVGTLVATGLAKRMSKLIGQYSIAAERIGDGHFEQPNWAKTDITEFSMLSHSINRMAAQLMCSDRAQKAFLQNASHELRTPLMSIQGYAEGIVGGIMPDVKQAASIIGDESKRLNTLVEELLTLSRIEGGSFHAKPVPLNLCSLLPEYAQRLGGLASKYHCKITLSLPDGAIVLLGDEGLLEHAVTNITANCLRYARSEVTIRASAKGERVEIRISDDGKGIAESDLPHLFERFYKGSGGNFGLGLAIAKSAISAIGGSLEAYNSNGAVFLITLPEYIVN